MKTIVRFIVAWLPLQCISSIAFEIRSILSFSFFSRSTLPTFILDLDHPWVKENRKYLERLDNPADALCNLDGTSRNGRHKVHHPPDLFKYLEIDNNKVGVDRPGWHNAEERLREMLACPAALDDVEYLKVKIWVTDGQYGIGWAEPIEPPRRLPDLFIQVLTSMPNLRKLEWDTFDKGHERFKRAFARANLNLPLVRQLVVAKNAGYLVSACLNTEELHSDLSLVKSTRHLSKLTTLEMQGNWEFNWETSHLEGLVETNPDLKSLRMKGKLYAGRWSPDSDESDILIQYLNILTRFTKLEALHLPASSDLRLGFDGGPRCGNAYFGRGGRRLRRQVQEDSAETTERATRMTLDRLPNLKSLSIGGYNVKVIRSDNGKPSAAWPWSSQGLHNWTLSNWPDIESDIEDEW